MRKDFVSIVIIAFFVGAIGSIVIGRFALPALADIQGFGWVSKFTTSAPLIINRTEEIHLNEGANLVEMAKQAGNITVSIYSANNTFLGNGIIITSDGLIFSSNTILNGQSQLIVVTNDGKKFTGTVRAKDPKSDLVVITIPASGLAVAQFEDAVNLQPGQRLVYIGRGSTEFQHVFQTGFVSQALSNNRSLQRVVATNEFVEQVSSDVLISSDLFGGPIINLNGKIVGMVLDETNNIIAENMQTALSAYLATGKIVRPYLGIRYLSLSKGLAAVQNLPTAGSLVTMVERLSPAEKAGVQVNDFITAVDGNALDQQSLERVLNRHSITDTRLSILRGGKALELTVKLEEK